MISTPLPLATTPASALPALTQTHPAPATTSTLSPPTNTAAQPPVMTSTVQAKKRKAQAEMKTLMDM